MEGISSRTSSNRGSPRSGDMSSESSPSYASPRGNNEFNQEVIIKNLIVSGGIY